MKIFWRWMVEMAAHDVHEPEALHCALKMFQVLNCVYVTTVLKIRFECLKTYTHQKPAAGYELTIRTTFADSWTNF